MQAEDLKELLAEMKVMPEKLRQLKSKQDNKAANVAEEVDMSEDAEDHNEESMEKPTWGFLPRPVWSDK